MALKLAGSKEFPNMAHLLRLAESDQIKIRNPKAIIESLSENILNYLKSSSEVQLFDGLRVSIECSISNIMTPSISTTSYRHDRKKKFE